ncbi:leucine-rich repeat domain-containing protein [Lachnospiraceae bacterium 54-53]
MFLYQIVDDHIRIVGYRGYDGAVRIPEQIEKRPVTELAAYAFSGGWGRNQMLASAENQILLCDEEGNPVSEAEEDLPPEICCERLKDLYLPDTVKKIGNYAFYNCYELIHVECFSSISDLGSGLFTGCSGIKYLDIHIVDGTRSCMKEILSELRQELYVNYYSSQGNARLVFPEMFEESVEHTPARIIIREMHGCGHMYRYCFDHTEFQFHKYDALFPHILVQEPERVVAALVLGRLFTPLGLQDPDKKTYEAYLKEHFTGAAGLALEDRDPALFLWLAGQYGADRKDFDRMVELAGKADKPELLSILMNVRRRRFPAEKRKFSL